MSIATVVWMAGVVVWSTALGWLAYGPLVAAVACGVALTLLGLLADVWGQ